MLSTAASSAPTPSKRDGSIAMKQTPWLSSAGVRSLKPALLRMPARTSTTSASPVPFGPPTGRSALPRARDARRHVKDEMRRLWAGHADRERVRGKTWLDGSVQCDDLVGAGVVRGEDHDHACLGSALDVVGETAHVSAAAHRHNGNAVLARSLDREVDGHHGRNLADCTAPVEDECGAVVPLNGRPRRRVDTARAAAIAVFTDEPDSVRRVPRISARTSNSAVVAAASTGAAAADRSAAASSWRSTGCRRI